MGSYENLLKQLKEEKLGQTKIQQDHKNDSPETNQLSQQSSPVTSDVRQNVNKQEMLKMANDFDINALIKQYLTDGVLTDKERQVILKKAEKMGLDRDEVDLYLDAEVQKLDMETDAAVRRQKGKQCPYCGAPIPQLADKCPECDQYITPEATKELEEILDNLEEALVNMKSQKDFDRNKAIVERYERKARMYYSNHPKIKALLVEVDNEMKDAETKIKSAARRKIMVSILTNKWLWFSIPIIIGVILVLVGLFYIPKGNQENVVGTGVCFIVGGLTVCVYAFLFSLRGKI